jgi:p-cumate 2,3-dioxygenase beta subunit
MSISREAVEDFLFMEAALLDEWKLAEWLELLTEDCTYLVPATDLPDGKPGVEMTLINDDAQKLRTRVEHLSSGLAWAERPPSRTRRLITNVRVRVDDVGRIGVTANFAVHRFRHEQSDCFVGVYRHELVEVDGRLKIRRRAAIVDLESLRPHSKISIIL